MKFIKKINEFFNPESEIEREDNFNLGHDEEEGDFYSHGEEGEHEEEEGEHEEENWGDEESSSLGTSRISSFDDYSFDEPSFDETEGNLANKDLEDEMANFNFKNDDEDDFSGEEFDPSVHHLEFSEEDEDCDTCEHDDEDEDFQEEGYVESFKSFNEKKKIPKGLQDYLDKKSNKKDSKEDKKDSKEDKKESGKGLTAAQKKLPEGLRKAIEKKNNKK